MVLQLIVREERTGEKRDYIKLLKVMLHFCSTLKYIRTSPMPSPAHKTDEWTTVKGQLTRERKGWIVKLIKDRNE